MYTGASAAATFNPTFLVLTGSGASIRAGPSRIYWYSRRMSSPVASLRTRFRSQRIANFTESVIREMTRLAMRHGATNLAQGFPDFPAPEALKLAAAEAIHADINQYSITWGAKPFRVPAAA